MSRELIERCREKALNQEVQSEEDGKALFAIPSDSIMDLMAAADAVRRKFKGDKISLCSIVNARSGKCGEDCAFCSQSVKATSDIPEYAMMGTEEITSAAEEAIKNGAQKFGIVTSGKGPEKQTGDFDKILASVKSMSEDVGVHACASLGVLNEEQAEALVNAGLKEYHHNIETARSFYPNICSTRSYDENINSVKAAKKAGLRICSGGIFGMGESPEQRYEMAVELHALAVESVPLNFLNPIEGTEMAALVRLNPLEILGIVAAFRLLLPTVDIKVAGGREVNLRDLQSFIFFAGANSTMIGNYLTTSGRDSAADLQMIKDMGLEAATC